VSIKKPFSEVEYEDLILLLKEWTDKYGESTFHGRRCKLKAAPGCKKETKEEVLRRFCEYLPDKEGYYGGISCIL
jgi:hypothetical protein